MRKILTKIYILQEKKKQSLKTKSKTKKHERTKRHYTRVMHNIPFAMRIRGTIESLKEEMVQNFGSDEYVDWTTLIESLEKTLAEMSDEELNEVMAVPEYAEDLDNDELEIW